ncbi:hypothetical protein QCA50_002120 [Cerrena zonata]|uniref:ACB domain-containing protein n=1 Tax=Cerrena zonata TaxID=2478898 RepID=A0AAW0GXD9_9APHY
MVEYRPSPSFDGAAKYLSNASSLASVSNTVKLELYGLFKYLTVSHIPNTGKPSIFDFTGRAKWDAWNTTGSTYGDRAEDAENRYLEIATSLGWKEGTTTEPEPEASTSASSNTAAGDEDDIWDKDTDGPKRSGGGFGVKVSMVSQETEEMREVGSLHALVLDGDVAGVEKHLQDHPDTNLNELDEHGYTPLHIASDRGHTKVVELLLSKGADKAIKDPDEFTALELAEVAEHDDIVTLLR